MAQATGFKLGRGESDNKKVQLPIYLREKSISKQGGKAKFRQKLMKLIEINFPGSTI